MADKLRTLQNLEALQARHVGTGHADTTKYEWTSNIIRDSYASYVGHPPLLGYMAIGMGESKEKVRVMMIEKMIRGAGNPPEVGPFPVCKYNLQRRPITNGGFLNGVGTRIILDGKKIFLRRRMLMFEHSSAR
jgi:splicing factor 3B subunit 5